MSWKFRLVNTAVMAFCLSGFMTMYVTWLNLGMTANFVQHWLTAWLCSAPAAFLGVLILATPVQKITRKLLNINN